MKARWEYLEESVTAERRHSLRKETQFSDEVHQSATMFYRRATVTQLTRDTFQELHVILHMVTHDNNKFLLHHKMTRHKRKT